MTLTQNGRDDLKTYYRSQAVPVYPCEKSDKTKWCKYFLDLYF